MFDVKKSIAETMINIVDEFYIKKEFVTSIRTFLNKSGYLTLSQLLSLYNVLETELITNKGVEDELAVAKLIGFDPQFIEDVVKADGRLYYRLRSQPIKSFGEGN